MMTLRRIFIMGVVLVSAVSAVSAVGIMTASAQGTKPSEKDTAWLGVAVADSDDGVIIEEVVADSPAEKAGLQVDDIIQAVDGDSITSARRFVRAVQAYDPGDEITLTVLSGDETRDITVMLGERPDEFDTEDETSVPSLGFGLGAHGGMLGFLGLDTTVQDDGLLIDAISEDSPLAGSGLQAGDVITEINGESTVKRRHGGMMFRFSFDKPLVFTVLRDGEEMDIEVDLQALAKWPDELQITPADPESGFSFRSGRPTQLGVQFRTLTPEYAQQEELPVEQGALVVEVYEDTPAAEAGLQVDDIITVVSGDVLDEERTLADRLVAYEEGDTVTLTVLRGGDEVTIEVTLGPRVSQSMWFGGSNLDMGPGHGGMFHFNFGDQDESTPAEPAVPDGQST